MTHFYQAYGLEVCSALEFPELQKGTGGGDVTITLSSRIEEAEEATPNGTGFTQASTGSIYYNPRVGIIFISGGNGIVAAPHRHADMQLLRLLILGPAFAMLLHQRGLLVLHAGAVTIRGKAILLMGEKGQGKSTTTLALHAAGHSFVTDDVAGIQCADAPPSIVPSFPFAKIDPRLFAEIPSARLMPITGHKKKRGYIISGLLAEGISPVHHVFSLTDDAEFSARTLTSGEAAIELLRHSFAARWLSHFPSNGEALLQCAALANAASVHTVRRPLDFTSLHSTLLYIENAVG